MANQEKEQKSKSETLNVPEELKAKFEEIKKKLDKFKKEILKKFDKYILGIALIPPDRESKEKNAINILVIVNDSDSKKMPKYELQDKLSAITEKTAKEIDKDLKIQIKLLTELREDCFDGKYEILETIALSAILYDPQDVLGALKVSEVHKKMSLKKFEKYIVSYVAAGSLFRGEKSHDIDVYIVVDDTDVKRMSRLELKDKLRAIIIGMGFEASKITGVDKSFHVQVYILTDFWESIKDASPVIFTLLRDGVPLYDRGVFMPWKLLLKMGRIKPSPEAIDMHMDISERLLMRVKGKLLSVVGEDLYYATMNPAQAALMLYGIPPPTHRETIKLLNDLFVKKEKLLEKKYVDIVDKTFKYFKDIEHGKVKEISGKEIDELLKEVEDYLKRIKRLFIQIEKRFEKKSILEFYETSIAVAQDIIKLENLKGDVIKGFSELVKKNKMPERFLQILKQIIKAKKDYEAKKISKQEIEKTRKEANIFVRAMLDYVQRKRSFELERVKIRVKYGSKVGEVLLLNDIAFIIKDVASKEKEIEKAPILEDGCFGKIEKSTPIELEEKIADMKMPMNVAIKPKVFEDLKRIFGKDVEIIV